MVVDALPDDGNLDDAIEQEQSIYDKVDNEISCIFRGIQKILWECTEITEVSARKSASRCLEDLEAELTSISKRITEIPTDDLSSIHIVWSYQQKVSDLGKSFSETKWNVMSSCTSDEVGRLTGTLNKISASLFDIGLYLRRLSD